MSKQARHPKGTPWRPTGPGPGRFAPKMATGAAGGFAQQLRKLSDDEFLRADDSGWDDEQVADYLRELDRRSKRGSRRAAKLAAQAEAIEAQHPDWTAEQVEHALTGKVWDEVEYRQAQLRHDHPGKSFMAAVGAEWREHVRIEAAEFAKTTRADPFAPHVRSQQAAHRGKWANLEPADLWRLPPDQAAAVASDEMKAFWQARGGRETWTTFLARYTRSSKVARRAEDARGAGRGRDYGL